MQYDVESQPRTVREALSALKVENLKPLAALVGPAPTRKGDLVDCVARSLEDRKAVRRFYDSLDDLSQKGVQEATYHLEGTLDLFQFQAKYGQVPDFGGSGHRSYHREPPRKPKVLRLFFPYRLMLPHDLQMILREFVPEPPGVTVTSFDELPARVRGPSWSDGEADENVELRIRLTDRVALHDVKAVLRLIDLGVVRIGEKARRPTIGAMKNIQGALVEGDFYSESEQREETGCPSSDLRIQVFAWPMLLQAAGLAEAAGNRLQLTAAGRKAMTKPAHELIRLIWDKWQKTTLVDEFNRINAINGQQAKGPVLTAVGPRRKTVVKVLHACPEQKWVTTDEFFRLLKVLAPDFEISHNEWKLYIGKQRYGSLDDVGPESWEMLQGRFTLAFLFEYAATLGLVDVAYLFPAGARSDYHRCWGTDDLDCLSRYDGLMYLRLNPLGAWCLGLTKAYEPAEVVPDPRLKVLPNRDIVTVDRSLAPADALFLERFAERKSESVWHLDTGKMLAAVENGLTVTELRAFLEARNEGPMPQTVRVFLEDLIARTGQLEDLGTARLISCQDTDVARLLVHDRRLRALCQMAGERQIVFRAADEPTVRRALKELGYVLPPPR